MLKNPSYNGQFWNTSLPKPLTSLVSYYPFGMVIEGRSGTAGDQYRYGFQGQESDKEVTGSESHYAFEFRIHDARIGRFLSIDPLAPKYVYNSPYAFSENRLIDCVELEGLETANIHDKNHAINNLTRPSSLQNGIQVRSPSGTWETVGDNFYTHGDYLLGGDQTYIWNFNLYTYEVYNAELPCEFAPMEKLISSTFRESDTYVISDENTVPFGGVHKPILPYYGDQSLYWNEFSYGLGPMNRVFLPDHPMSGQIYDSYLFQDILNEFYNGGLINDVNGWKIKTNSDGSTTYSKYADFGLIDHLYNSGATLFTGSSKISFVQVPKSDEIFVMVYNATGKCSYYYHLTDDLKMTNDDDSYPNSWIRYPEANIYQIYLFLIPMRR